MSVPKEKGPGTSIEKMLENEVPDVQTQNDLKAEQNSKSKTKIKERGLIKNVNNQVLIDFLSPEIAKNEFAKRMHKYILIILLGIFLVIQFWSVFTITTSVISYATSDDANVEIVKTVLAFVSAYITSVVIELIAILNYIVKNVFDTSLAELVTIFKDTELQNKKEHE